MSEAAGHADDDLFVADSFRVRVSRGAAQIRGFRNHLARFTASVRSACADLDMQLGECDIENFLRDSLAQIEDYGEGNPRLELWGGVHRTPQLRLSLRPLPELTESIELRSAGKTAVTPWHPERKGRNIGLFSALTRALGAEALLTNAGAVTEGATTALIWWAGTEGYVSASTRRVASITEGLLREIAADQGERLTPAHVTTGELARCEIWAVNALHGLRTVTSLDGRQLPTPDPHRLSKYRAALNRTWEDVAGIAL